MKSKWQKLCDSADWFDPEFRDIVINNLRTQPRLHRKQWEFAMIFRVLKDAGLLNDQSEGIAFGAGKERLLYSVMEKVKKLTATDIYGEDAKWYNTKTNDPKNYILDAAPFPVDPHKLDAKYMDMRKITYPDNSFDFAYSSCVFEHISEDDAGFVEHLLEVKRTLKEGGVYVLTTELLYGEKTMAIPGNYFFELNHLITILQQSGLHLSPVFDARLSEVNANHAMPFPADDYGFYPAQAWLPHVTCHRQSLSYTSCLFTLTKKSNEKPQAIKTIGYEKSKIFIENTLNSNRNLLWRNWQNVSVFRRGIDSPAIIGHEDFKIDVARTDDHLVIHTPFFQFGEGEIESKIALIPANNESIHLKLFSFDSYQGKDLRIENDFLLHCEKNKGSVLNLDCELEPNRIYAILGRGKALFESVTIQFRKKS